MSVALTKVIQHVLEGLLLGTSCSLALLLEDRRRRISTVQSIIDKSRRLKQFPLYREGGAERAISRALVKFNIDKEPTAKYASEAASPPPPPPPPPPPQPPSVKEHHDPRDLPDDQPQPAGQPRSGSDDTQVPEGATCRPEIPIRWPLVVGHSERLSFEKYYRAIRKPSRWHWHLRMPENADATDLVVSPSVARHAMETIPHILLTVLDMLESNNGEWKQHWNVTLEALKGPLAKAVLRTSQLHNVIKLARILEHRGEVSEATQAMKLVINLRRVPGMITRQKFVEHVLESFIKVLLGRPTSEACRLAVHFYVSAFGSQSSPNEHSDPQLTNSLFSATLHFRLYDLAQNVMMLNASKDCYWEMQDAYILALCQHDASSRAIEYFFQHYAKCRLTEATPFTTHVIDLIINCNTKLGGLYSCDIANLLIATPVLHPLKGAWVCRLIDAHWKHHGDYEETKTYHIKLSSLCNSNEVTSQAFLQIAHAAGCTPDTLSLLEKLQAEPKTPRRHISLLGKVALIQATSNHWDECRRTFQEMVAEVHTASTKAATRLPTEVSRALTPVIKEYTNSHSMKETEAFVFDLIENVGVEVDRYHIPLVAKGYAMERDTEGLGKWLAFCASRGFVEDELFLEAIIASYSHWKCHHMKSRAFRHLLAKVYPDAASFTSVNSVRNSAAFQSTSRRRTDLQAAVAPVESGCEKDVLRAMQAAIRRGAPQVALEIFHDVKIVDGMDTSGHCLRHAVLASLLACDGDPTEAKRLLMTAKGQQRRLSQAIVPLLAAHLNSIGPFQNPVEEFVKFMGGFEEVPIRSLSSKTFTLICYYFIKASRYQDAISLCYESMKLNETPGVASNKHHFQILTEAYSMTMNAAALRHLFSQARIRAYIVDSACLRTLQRVKYDVAKLLLTLEPGHDGLYIREVLQILDKMIAEVKAIRASVQGSVLKLTGQVRDILKGAKYNVHT